MVLALLTVASAMSFFYYGGETLFARPPRGEYERFGMPKLRVFAGSMQVLGGLGVLGGLFFPLLGAAAAAGLTVMMVLGLAARWRLHDAPRLMVPAGSLAILNGILLVWFLAQ